MDLWCSVPVSSHISSQKGKDMLSCSALASLTFMLNFIFELTHETWLLVLSSSKVLGDLSQIESVDKWHEVHMYQEEKCEG